MAGSGSAERQLGYGEPADPTQVYDANQGPPTREEDDAPARSLLPESGPHGAPSKVGRYVVLDVLGVGGMGVVCTAYDPKLDRKVALKLLRRRVGRKSRTSTGRARLVREAQSLAKLSHPNIVTVHDVDTTPDGRIYMAMEFVRGQTITQWLTAEKPGWRRILEIFAEAGRGLGAAHAANIIHRDFKPANVIIGENGRVKVLDFGLAKSETTNISGESDDEGRSEPGEGEDIMQVVQSTGDMKLTMAGRIVGTPAYMAPEQRRGKATGPATDQFSFAVSLYEALYGRLPFRSESHSRDAARGRIVDPPSDSEVPGWVFRAVKRALSPETGDRYPTMQAFLAALQADPAKRRRKIAMYSGGAIVLGGTIAFAALAQQEDDELCKGARGRLASVWDEERRSLVDASLRGTATAYAAYTADRVLESIDAYADTWVEARTSVCEATWVHGEQSESTLDVRMGCLDQRQGELRALVEVLSDADGEVVERAVSAVAALGSPEDCVTAEPGTANRMPDDPALRRAIADARARIDDAEALLRAGRYPLAQDVARESVALATATKHTPTEARATHIQGLVAQKLGDYEFASSRFKRAAEEAARSGDAELEGRALISLVRVAGVHMHNREQALGLAVGAESALVRAGSPAELRSRLSLQLGGTAIAAKETEEAVGHLREALSAAERSYPAGDVRFAGLLVNLGVALAQSGDWVEAEALFRRALDLRETKQGPMHPEVASAAQNLANVLASKPAGLAEAIELTNRSMAIRRAVLGPDTKVVANLWLTKARLHTRAKQTELAMSEYERAVEIYRKVGAGPELGDALNNLANLQLASEDFDAAARSAKEAISTFEGTSTRSVEGRARASLRLCIASRRSVPPAADTPARCETAVAEMRRAQPDGGDELALALRELALAREANGEFSKALDAAREAITTATKDEPRNEATELLDRLQKRSR